MGMETQRIVYVDSNGQAIDNALFYAWTDTGEGRGQSVVQESNCVKCNVSWASSMAGVCTGPLNLHKRTESAKLVVKYITGGTASNRKSVRALTTCRAAGDETTSETMVQDGLPNSSSVITQEVDIFDYKDYPEGVIFLVATTTDVSASQLYIYEMYVEFYGPAPLKYFSADNMKYLLTQLSQRLADEHINE